MHRILFALVLAFGPAISRAAIVIPDLDNLIDAAGWEADNSLPLDWTAAPASTPLIGTSTRLSCALSRLANAAHIDQSTESMP